jgi:5-methyltetrahydropteroyltriglutamate--homocysteine methyltransferase
VGSLVRPPGLADELRAFEGGKLDSTALQPTIAAAAMVVVRRQRQVGLDIINDGEFSKLHGWARYVYERLEGFEQLRAAAGPSTPAPSVFGKDMRDFQDFYREYFRHEDSKPNPTGPWVVSGRVRYRGLEAVSRDIARLKAALEGVEVTDVFMPAVAPGSIVPQSWNGYYSREEDFLTDLADALHEEYRAITDAGFIVQVDDAYLATTYDVMVPPGTLSDYRRWAELRVETLNRALRGIPLERTRYHVCWGSWNGPHSNDVPLRDIVDLILRVRTGGYSLEMANPRHEHEWRVWETVRLPGNSMLVPGVVSHCTNVVEHPELVAERIGRLARLVGPERVIASTDCGFAQGPLVRRVHESVMWAKLASLVEGAGLASREFG